MSETILSKRNLFVFAGLVALFVFAGLLFSLPRSSAATSLSYWTVLFAEGKSQWRPAGSDDDWELLNRNQQLPAKVEIRTFAAAHAVVVHGLDNIELRPDSTVSIAPEADRDATTLVTQSKGSVGYTVQKRKSGTFSVKTPYLVAVVKGTSFGVDVDEDSAKVDVSQGNVSVTDSRDGSSTDVSAGMSASASAGEAGVSSSQSGRSGSSGSSGRSGADNSGRGNSNAGGNGGGSGGGNGGGNGAGDESRNAGGGNNGGGNGGGGGNRQALAPRVERR